MASLNEQQKALLINEIQKGEILIVKPTGMIDSVGRESSVVPGTIVAVNGNTVTLENHVEKNEKDGSLPLGLRQTGVWVHFDLPAPGYNLRFLRLN